jgi:large subunit ribosomal protein L22
MEVRAVAKYIKVQPRKVRIVAAHVRGKNAQQMVDVLRFHPSKGAFYLRKAIMSAIGNAVENAEADASTLVITEVRVDEGPKTKRIQARAMGRANRIMKKTSHITVAVDEAPEKEAVKPHGTQPKARPTFVEKKGKGKKAKKDDAKVEEAAAPVEAVTEEAVAEPEAIVEETVAETPEAVADEAPAEVEAEAPAETEEEKS